MWVNNCSEFTFIINTLAKLRKAEAGLQGMHTAQAGDLVAHLGAENRRRFFRKQFARLLHSNSRQGLF
jgi:hypothetical protein